MWLLMNRRLNLMVGAVVLGTAACGTQQPGLGANPYPSAFLSPAPTVSAPDCRNAIQDASIANPLPTLDREITSVAVTATVFVARLANRRASEYETLDNTRPSDGSVGIYTPWGLSVVDRWSGPIDPSNGVAVDGGTVGCDSMTPYTDFGFKEQGTYVITVVPSQLPGTKGLPQVIEAWPVLDGQVIVPQAVFRTDPSLLATPHTATLLSVPNRSTVVTGSAVPLDLLRRYVVRLTGQ